MTPDVPLFKRVEPARLLFDINLSAKIWFGLFLITLLALVLCLAALLRPRTFQPDGVFVVGGDGWPYWAKRVDWGAATNLHVRMADEATKAFLLRNPAGFDSPELVNLLFLPEAAAAAHADCEREAPDRQAKELHQKPESFSAHYLRLPNDRTRVSVHGQLVESGLFRGQPIAGAVPFQIDLELVPNPNLALNGLIPLVVRQYRYEPVRP